jgi:hypothetical protein
MQNERPNPQIRKVDKESFRGLLLGREIAKTAPMQRWGDRAEEMRNSI